MPLPLYLDRQHPAVCKSLRSQNVMYVTCGEDHTAALTQDGGLFLFGAGTYGQLGQGSKTHEIMPRKCMELMGTRVSQVACGRSAHQHDVACIVMNYCEIIFIC